MKQVVLLSLCSLLLFPQLSQGQTRTVNLSLQAGYQFKFLNPQPFNFALDSLANVVNGSPEEAFERVRWVPGFAGAIGWHRGRMNLRLHGNQFQGNSDFLGADSLGETIQREARIAGWNIGVSIDGQLIPFDEWGGVYVGGAFQVSQLTTYLRSALEGQALPDFTQTSRVTKPSFSIMLPFRFQPIPRIQISLEPYFQVFFAPTRFNGFSRALNGETLTTENSGRLIGETDHFGTTLQVVFFLLGE